METRTFPTKTIIVLLVALLALYVGFGQLKAEREVGVANAQGADDLSQTLWMENVEFRRVNTWQQRGVLMVAAAVALVGLAGWLRQKRGAHE